MNSAAQRLWTKDFFIISLISFLYGLLFYITVTLMAKFSIEKFGATESEAGLASSIFVIGVILTRMLTGKYMDFAGRKKLFYSGVIFIFLLSFAYFFVNHIYILIFLRFLHGAVFGISFTVMQTAVVDLIPENRRGEGISYYSLSFIVATAIGPFMGVVISPYGENLMFLICVILTGMSFIFSLFLKIDEQPLTKEQIEEMKGFHLKDFFEKGALPISIIMGILSFSYSSILSFLSLYAKEINLFTAASFFFIVYAGIVLVSRPITGKVLDIKGENIIMYPAFLLYSLGFVLISQAHHGWTLLLGGVLIGLGYGNLQSSIQAIAIKYAPRHLTGLATSTFFICMEFGVGLGPFLIGFVLPLLGYRNLYFSLAIVVAGCLFLYYFFHGKRQTFNKHISHEM